RRNMFRIGWIVVEVEHQLDIKSVVTCGSCYFLNQFPVVRIRNDDFIHKVCSSHLRKVFDSAQQVRVTAFVPIHETLDVVPKVPVLFQDTSQTLAHSEKYYLPPKNPPTAKCHETEYDDKTSCTLRKHFAGCYELD